MFYSSEVRNYVNFFYYNYWCTPKTKKKKPMNTKYMRKPSAINDNNFDIFFSTGKAMLAEIFSLSKVIPDGAESMHINKASYK